MNNLEQMEKRWKELVGKPRTSEEVQETLLLAKKIELERAKEYQGLIDELANMGIKINSIWDLVNTKSKYPKAIPVLMKYLPLVNYVRNKEGIVRALTVPEAKGFVVPLLVNEYLQLPNNQENLKWVIGNAVNATITKGEVENILPIVLNKDNGVSRQMFVSALGKIKTDNVKSVLVQLSNDDDEVIRDEVKKALKKVS